MLSQQVDRANEGWTPDWDSDEYIYTIVYPNRLHRDFGVFNSSYYRFLAFKSREIAEEFLKVNIDLIKQAAVFLV